MVVADVECAIRQVRPHLFRYQRSRPGMSLNDEAPANRSEMSTRYIVIDPVLRSLGWDLSNPSQCVVEYRIVMRDRAGNYGGSRTADYALLGSDGYPVVLVEAKRLELSSRTVPYAAYREERQKDWLDGKNQLLDYLKNVGRAAAGMLTNGQEWLFVEWVDEWKWDDRPIRLSGRNVQLNSRRLHERLDRECYPPLDSL